MTMAAATMRAWRAALAAALRPAAVVRLKRVRTSHMRTQLCTTVALRFLHPSHHKLKHTHGTQHHSQVTSGPFSQSIYCKIGWTAQHCRKDTVL